MKKNGLEHLGKVSGLISRVADSKETAELALFLASRKSSYMNDSCAPTDGRWTVL